MYICIVIHRELELTVAGLQKNIQMLKSEISRYKTRAHKAEEKLNKITVSETSSNKICVPSVPTYACTCAACTCI